MRSVSLCIPTTWTPVIRGLLEEPTKPYFWRNDADPADVEAAQQIARETLVTFDTEECGCVAECSTLQTDTYNFLYSDGGFVAGLYGAYYFGAWHGVITDETDGRHCRLNITRPVSNWIEEFSLLKYRYAVVGTPGYSAPMSIELEARHNTITTGLYKFGAGIYADPFVGDAAFGAAQWFVQGGCKIPADSVFVRVDIGPYDQNFVWSSFSIESAQYSFRVGG